MLTQDKETSVPKQRLSLLKTGAIVVSGTGSTSTIYIDRRAL